jgi:uncharacterized membrane protein
MPVEGIVEIVLVVTTFLCALTAGLLFAFAVVVMPGIGRLGDAAFVRAFQVIDSVIQNNQPLFMLVWIGSILAMLAAVVLGIWQLEGAERLLIVAAALVYFLGVQLPTVRINVPLNNELQTLNVGTMTAAEQETARAGFEPRWNRSNAIRTAFACLTSILLMVLLLGLTP